MEDIDSFINVLIWIVFIGSWLFGALFNRKKRKSGPSDPETDFGEDPLFAEREDEEEDPFEMLDKVLKNQRKNTLDHEPIDTKAIPKKDLSPTLSDPQIPLIPSSLNAWEGKPIKEVPLIPSSTASIYQAYSRSPKSVQKGLRSGIRSRLRSLRSRREAMLLRDVLGPPKSLL